jgi:hypothetical protein
MKEIQNILKKAEELSDGEKAILATVVDVVGSVIAVRERGC